MEVSILLISFIGTMLSVMSGGGAATINTPSFLMLGISLPMVTSMQKFASAFWVLPSGYRYLKKRKIDVLFLLAFSVLGLFGVWLGVNFLLDLPKRVFEITIAIIIICLVFYSYFKKSFGEQKKEYKKQTLFHKILIFPTSIIFGFYEGFFGAGNGIFFSTFTNLTRGWGLKEALGYYFIATWSWNLYAAYLFIIKGYFSVSLMIPVTLGSLAGALLGSWYIQKKSNLFVKKVFQLMGVLLAVKLFIGI